jgi:hypothetical protein
MRLALCFLLTLCLVLNVRAADQKGAEITKTPKSVEIVVASAATGEQPDIGNVQIIYSDGTKDRWTTKGNCSLARLSSDGTVGWTVHGVLSNVASSYKLRPYDTLVLCRKGKVVAQCKSGKGFIEDWMFTADGSRFVLLTRGAHGPADIELHDANTGKLIQSVKAYDDNLPAWAQPYKEK